MSYKKPSRSRQESSFLSRIDLKEAKHLKVAIRRMDITTSGPPMPILRSLEDPSSLKIHFREDEGRRGIFEREDILVNPREESTEERVVMAHHNERTTTYKSTSKSPQRKNRTRRSRSYSPRKVTRSIDERYRSRSPHKRRSRTPLRPGEYRPSREKEYQEQVRYSRSRKTRSVSREKYKTRRKSPSPSTSRRYSRSPPTSRAKKYYERRSRSHEKRRSKSPEASSSRSSVKPHYATSSKRSSPSRYESEYRKRSRSPPRYRVEKRRRSASRSPSRRYYPSRSKSRRRSRTPTQIPMADPMMHAYPYYMAPEYWPMKPGFMPRMMHHPRGMAPILMPRMPMMGPYGPAQYPPPPRQRLPVYNNRRIKIMSDIDVGVSSTANESIKSDDKNEEVDGGMQEVDGGMQEATGSQMIQEEHEERLGDEDQMNKNIED